MVQMAKSLAIPESRLTQIYFECVEYVNAIWRQLHTPMVCMKEDDAESPEEKEETISE